MEIDQQPMRVDHSGQVLREWVIPEYTQHERSRRWFIVAGVVLVALAVLSLWTPNFAFDTPNILFLSFVLITAVTLVARHMYQPPLLSVVIYEDGVAIGEHFHTFRELKNFAIIYEPPHVQMLYFHFESGWRPRLPVPLAEEHPVEIREILLQYLEEDLERESEPTSDAFGRWLKL